METESAEEIPKQKRPMVDVDLMSVVVVRIFDSALLECARTVGQIGAESGGREELEQLRVRNATERRRAAQLRLDLKEKSIVAVEID